jgi:hypothetical protein
LPVRLPGVAITDEEIHAINITPDKFYGEWNYTIALNLEPL